MQQALDSFLHRFGDQPAVHAAVILVASVIVAALFNLLVTRVFKSWTKRTRTDLDDRLLALLHRPVFVSVVLLGLWLALTPFALPEELTRLIRRLLQTVALVVWAAFLLRGSSLALELLERLQHRSRLIDQRTLTLLDNLAKVVFVAGAIYFLFLTWGINVGPFLLTGGVVGVAIGFAAKDTLANLFSGIFILADAPYKLGDFIVLDSGERGEVTQIGLRSTRLLTRDDVEVTIPNAVIANAKIVNESGGPWIKQRVRIKVGAAYGSDVDRVKEILLGVATDHSDVEAEPEPRVRFRAFGESSLDFELLAWVREPVARGRVTDALNTEVYKRFQHGGIEIPYPKRDVYLHRVGAAEEG